jgi:hypothetical protein
MRAFMVSFVCTAMISPFTQCSKIDDRFSFLPALAANESGRKLLDVTQVLTVWQCAISLFGGFGALRAVLAKRRGCAPVTYKEKR